MTRALLYCSVKTSLIILQRCRRGDVCEGHTLHPDELNGQPNGEQSLECSHQNKLNHCQSCYPVNKTLMLLKKQQQENILKNGHPPGRLLWWEMKQWFRDKVIQKDSKENDGHPHSRGPIQFNKRIIRETLNENNWNKSSSTVIWLKIAWDQPKWSTNL